MRFRYLTHQVPWLLFVFAALSVADEAARDSQALLQARVSQLPKELARPSCSREAHAHWLRNSRNSRVLLFWAVSQSPTVIELVMQNVNHARTFTALEVDVYLNHYDMGKDAWLEKGMAWYTANVNYSSMLDGVKFYAAQEALLPNSSEVLFPSSSAPPIVDILSYEWIWFLDEDADFRLMDLEEMVHSARASGSMILTPSIVFSPPDQTGSLTLENASGALVSFDHEETSTQCQEYDFQCRMQAPNKDCKYRHTAFIEVSFPLMRPQAFNSTVSLCSSCISKNTSWGLDRVWCSLVARSSCTSPSRVCAVLDNVSIVHRNFKTLPKYKKVLASEVKSENYKAMNDVLDEWHPNFDTGFRIFDCIRA